MASLFSYADVKNKPSRSGFDLSSKKAFTAKVGELLPVYYKPTLPGDKFTISQDWFVRTQPVDTSAFTRIREYYEWFFVPLRQIWRLGPEAIMSMTNENLYATGIDSPNQIGLNFPALNLWDLYKIYNSTGTEYLAGKKNAFGFDRAELAGKLTAYLGYSSFFLKPAGKPIPPGDQTGYPFRDNPLVNLFPFAVYQKIYQDCYRNTQWERRDASSYNFDYFQGSTTTIALPQGSNSYWNNMGLFDLRYSNWKKDLYTGALPESQMGEVASINLGGSSSSYNAPVMVMMNDTKLASVRTATQMTSSSPTTQIAVNGLTTRSVSSGEPLQCQVQGSSFAASFSVLQLRAAEALQKWKEIAQSANQNYRDQVKAHFGVTPPEHLSGLCERIGGFDGNIDISAVDNTNLSDSEAVIRGKGIGGMTGSRELHFECKEHGFIMCIYHAEPLLDYVRSGTDLSILRTTADSYPIPEMDSLGLEPLVFLSQCNSAKVFFNTNGLNPRSQIGYTPRYIDWKTSVDDVTGAFATTLKSWVAPIDDDYLFKYLKPLLDSSSTGISYPWFKTNPSIVDPIFMVEANSSVDTDCLLCNAQFNVKVARNLNYDGMPY